MPETLHCALHATAVSRLTTVRLLWHLSGQHCTEGRSPKLHTSESARRVKKCHGCAKLLRDVVWVVCWLQCKLEASSGWHTAAWPRKRREHAELSPQCPAAAR